jgi:mitochondrial import inner membrane translocase subunit TIM16
VLGRAFAEAYRQANASSAYARANAKAGGSVSSTGRANIATGMTLEEACQILNVKPPSKIVRKAGSGGSAAAEAGVAEKEMEEVYSRFKRLFDANDPQKGGSFYLQSKVLRARERIEAEMAPARERAEQEAERAAPKMYKDR